MHSWRLPLWPTLLLVFSMAFTPTASAQASPAAPDIVQAQKALANDTTISPTQREVLAATLGRAAESVTEADTLLAKAREHNEATISFQARIDALETELRADPSELFERWRERFDLDAAPAELTRQLAEREAAITDLSAQIADTIAQLASVDQRPSAIVRELELARRALDELTNRPPASDTSTLAQRIDALALQASEREQLARIQSLDAERAALPLRSRVLELNQRSLQRQITLVRRQADVIGSVVARSTDAELLALDSRLRDEADDTQGQSPLLATTAARNLAIGKELTSAETSSRQASDTLRQTRARIEETADTLRNTRARLALHSRDDAVGQILLNERRRTDEPLRIQQDLSQTRRKLAQTQLRLIDLLEQSNILASPDEAIRALQHEGDDEIAGVDHAIRDRLHDLLVTQAELVARLVSAERELLRVLTELEAALVRHLDNTTILSQLLDRELLWFPSHERIGRSWFTRQAEGWGDLLRPARYATAGKALLETIRREWPLLVLFGLLYALLVRQYRQTPEKLALLAQPLTRVRSDRYMHTLRALATTAIAALTLPLPMALIGWLLRQSGKPGRFSDSLGKALLLTAAALLCYQGLRWLVVENGLAQKHFRWVRARRNAIASALPWFQYVVLPIHFLLILSFLRGQEPATDTAARLLALLACGLGAWLTWRLLAPGALWTFRSTAEPEPSTVRRALRLGLIAGLMVIAMLIINGYLLSAALLLHSLWLSMVLAVVLALFHGLASRWFLLGERRLVLQRLEARHEAELHRQDAPAEGTTPAEESALDPESEALSIQSVGLQTRRLLRAVTIVLVTLGLIWVWSDILPALDRLDTITLWSSTGIDASGTPISSPVTLAAVLGGLLTLSLAFISARNLPGLVELSLLSRIHLDAGTRYAITSISRYLIVITGMIIGLSLLGIRWAQLQWLAAALTVGLSFGLQEIFANFVSGLIVLFERPYRVGDWVTIGTVEGRVTRIRTRATTVLDSDNREVMVPNKAFITSQIINWTLSDTVTRVVFTLELSQDVDPARIRTILLELAHSDALVLEQPSPACWFMQISSGNYTFELRVFVAELGHRLRVRDELNRRIVTALADAGMATFHPGLLRVRMEEQDQLPSGEARKTSPTSPADLPGNS